MSLTVHHLACGHLHAGAARFLYERGFDPRAVQHIDAPTSPGPTWQAE
jgi:hypothetical protein